MEILLWMDSKNYQKVRELLLRDEVVSLASLTFKEAKDFGKEGYYCLISGLEQQCKKALEIVKNQAKEVSGEEKENFIKKIKEEENKAIEGFGSILG